MPAADGSGTCSTRGAARPWRFADGLATAEALAEAEAECKAIAKEALASGRPDDGAWACYALCDVVAGQTSSGPGAVNAAGIAVRAVEREAFSEALRQGRPRPEAQAASERRAEEERAEQCQLLREVFGNPFRPPPPKQGKRTWEEAVRGWMRWHEGVARKLAELIYEERRFDDLPVLADALEEAGCADAAILGHLRGPGLHARGCWALDLLLERG